jgi:hypothetical protein
VELYRKHLHYHPEFPFDSNGTYLTAKEIHERATREMYDYGFKNDLSQVWAYMWNRWYCPNQWILWATSACDEIPRIKTTMIVESLWRHFKHRDLAHFNHPRLDLVMYLLITHILERVQRTLDLLQEIHRHGRPRALAGWQTAFRDAWLDMGHSDEYRLTAKELEVRHKEKRGPARDQRLAQIEKENQSDPGTHHTDLSRWVCSCPAFLISRFLLCKHLVREANRLTKNKLKDDLRFFLNLRHNTRPPFYSIPGVHDIDSNWQDSSDDEQRVATMNLNSLLERKDDGCEQITEVDTTPGATPCENQPNDNDNAPDNGRNESTGPWVDIEGDDHAEETRRVSASNARTTQPH